MSSKLESVFFASMESTVVLIMEITAARVSSGITRSAVLMLMPCSQHSSGVYLNNPVADIVVKLIAAWACLSWILLSSFIVVSFYPVAGGGFPVFHFVSAYHPPFRFVKVKEFFAFVRGAPCFFEAFHAFLKSWRFKSPTLYLFFSIVYSRFYTLRNCSCNFCNSSCFYLQRLLQLLQLWLLVPIVACNSSCF